MTPPANTPDAPVPSETPAEVAVTSQPAESAEAVSGNQFPTPEAQSEPTWQEMLAALEAQEAAAAADPDAVSPEQVAAQAVTPTNPEDSAAGVAAVEDPTLAAGDEKHGPQHRIRPRSDTDEQVLQLMSRNQDMTLEEALAKVKGHTTSEQQDTAQADSPVPPAVAAASSLDALVARQEEVYQELQAAQADMDFELAGRLQVEALKLIEEKARAEALKTQADAQEAAAWDRQVQQAEAKALALYPSMEAPNSALFARMEAIHAVMEANADPLIHSPEYGLKLAQMAAGQLGIAPQVTSPAPAAAAQAAISPRAPMRVTPAAGGNVSGAVTATAQSAKLSAMDNWTPEQWENARASGEFDSLLD